MEIAPTDKTLTDLAAQLGRRLLASRRRLVTAESCTAGWIGKAMTDVAGSSAWFLGGVIAYSNDLKQRLLNIDAATLARSGAVSEPVVRGMAEGALSKLGGEVAIAISGVAGPDGGTSEKPVGTVWFAWSLQRDGRTETLAERHNFPGDREQVRRQSVALALTRALEL